MNKINPWVLWLASIFLMVAAVYAFANERPVIYCGSLVGSGLVRFEFPDKTFVININCPASTV
jgi:hypothetical protein